MTRTPGNRQSHERQPQPQGFALVVSLIFLTGLATLLSVGLLRSLNEQQLVTRHLATQQAFHAAEGGVDSILQRLNDQNCSDGICVGTRGQQRDILQWVHNQNPGLPAGMPALLSLPAPLAFNWCQPTGGIVSNRFFPVCIRGEAPNGPGQETSEIKLVVELPPPPGGSSGVMALSEIRFGENTHLRGDVVLLKGGDQYGSVYIGKGASIQPALDGKGGRILIRDLEGQNRDLRTTANGGEMPPILNAALEPTEFPVLTGWTANPAFPVITHGDNVKGVREQFANELATYGGVTESTLDQFVKRFIPSNNLPVAQKAMVLQTFLARERGQSLAEIVAYLKDMDRFIGARTPPTTAQVSTIPVGSGLPPDINQGDWKIEPRLGSPPYFTLIDTQTNREEAPTGSLPGGVWRLQSIGVAKLGVLQFQGRTKLYLLGDAGAYTMWMAETTRIEAVDEHGEPIPNGVEVIVPCLERAEGNVLNECQNLDEWTGLCHDPEQSNPDLVACTDNNTGEVSLGKGLTLTGSIHAPTRGLRLGEGVTIDGDYAVANIVHVGKGSEFHIPMELNVITDENSAPVIATIRLWQQYQ